MKRRCNIRTVRLNHVVYELRNVSGNFMTHFFGVLFPNIMCVLMAKVWGKQVPAAMRAEMNTTFMLSMALVMPMAIMFIGYGALYAQELEKGVPLRMSLFGYGGRTEIMAKLIAHLAFMTVAMALYAAVQSIVLDLQRPTFPALLCLIVSLYVIGIILLVIAHSIARLCRKFSTTFGVTLILYFMMMTVTGMVGIRTNQLPGWLRRVAEMVPMTYISNDFIEFWQGGSYNFMPFIQSFIFMGALAGILLLVSAYKDRRVLR